MGSRMTRTSGVLAAALMVLSPVLVACGGDEEPEAEPSPTEESTSAPSTPSPSPTKPEEPLSEFEDEAPVKAARTWAALLGRGVNKGDDAMRTVAPWATRSGVDVSVRVTTTDRTEGYRWPGPQPFTPVGVRRNGSAASINGCFLESGWSRDPESGKRVGKRAVGPYRIDLRRVGKRWKVTDFSNAAISCKGVEVKGVKW